VLEVLRVGLPEAELFDPAVGVKLKVEETVDSNVCVVPEEVLEPAGLALEVVDPDMTALGLELEVGAEVEVGAAVEVELVPELPTGITTPPSAFPDDVVEEVPAAADLYAARVSAPDEGGLTTPAMPPWQ